MSIQNVNELIGFDEQTKTFHLKSNKTSYLLQITSAGHLAHLYWGQSIRNYHGALPLEFMDRAFSPVPEAEKRHYSLDILPQEYPAYGNSDFRNPAYQIQLENGTTITDLKYKSHTVTSGKPQLEGLPATYVENDEEAATLNIVLEDALIGLEVTLSYSIFRNFDAITRSVRFENLGKTNIKLLKALSASIDFRHGEFEMLDLSGAWGRERHLKRRSLSQGMTRVESRRGASSHQHNPFIAITTPKTDEDHGDVYGLSLVYSGNFTAEAEVDQYKNTRISMGINPFDFSWLLEPGEVFQTPELVMVYSANGLGEMSHTYHKLYQSRLSRGKYRDKARPILINNWEATYFNFDADKIVEIAKTGKELGIELMVLDDGWFGHRDDDHSSLGDWFVDKNKLPEGLENLGKRINDLGMSFGLWFEPEMVSPDSDLYRSHPDWCIHVPDRYRSEGRNQLILDYSRKEVCDAIIKMVSDILKSAPISYVKWDMNRHMTEIGSAALPPERQRETAHRYILGVYRVMGEITKAFPDILFESCSGGGGRFDPGILYYMPQTWTSDNTDAVSRLSIQYGTSLVYPIVSMGSHVSAVPNHQVGRFTSLDIRGHVAMAGNLGYELDLTKLTDEEKQTVTAQVGLYKEIRELIQFGNFERILSPFEGNETAWLFVSEDQSEAVAFYYKVLAEPNPPKAALRLKGLDPNAAYEVIESGEIFGGDELMNMGLSLPFLQGDYQSLMVRLKKVEA